MADSLEIRQDGDRLCFSVRVQPRSAKLEISGVLDGHLKIRLTAPPLEDRANRQLLEFLAGILRIPPRDLLLVAGHRFRTKTVGVRGLNHAQLLERLRLEPR